MVPCSCYYYRDLDDQGKQGEWKGRWSDGSSEWESSNLTKVSHTRFPGQFNSRRLRFAVGLSWR